jgi:hypothetical protein
MQLDEILYCTNKGSCSELLSRYYYSHGLENYKDTKEKCRHLKNLPVKGLCVDVYLSEAPSPPRFLFGVEVSPVYKL